MTSPFSLIFDLTPEICNFKLSGIFETVMVDIAKSSDSYAFSPEAAATMMATGLSLHIVVETFQSIKFFNPPGRLKIDSGVEMITASASVVDFRNAEMI